MTKFATKVNENCNNENHSYEICDDKICVNENKIEGDRNSEDNVRHAYICIADDKLNLLFSSSDNLITFWQLVNGQVNGFYRLKVS